MKTMTKNLNFSIDLSQLLDESGVKKPVLHFTNDAYLKMKSLVNGCKDEIAWHGTVTKCANHYLVDDILVYPQTVTGTTVNTDQTEYSMWLMQQPDEIFPRIRLQGHSHVNMQTSPSGVDTAWYEAILEQIKDNDFYIFLILNKSGDLNVWIHDLAQNIIFEKADITIGVRLSDNSLLNVWSAETMETNLKKPEVKIYSAINAQTTVVEAQARWDALRAGNPYYDNKTAMTSNDLPGYEHFNKKTDKDSKKNKNKRRYY